MNQKKEFIKAISEADVCYMSAATFVETSMAIDARMGSDGIRDLDAFIAQANIQIIDLNKSQTLLARRAYHLFGKGKHPAKLNFRDCFSYAPAKERKQVLLYKGDDFLQTDITPYSAQVRPLIDIDLR